MRPQIMPPETSKLKTITVIHQIFSMKPLFPGSQSGNSLGSLSG
jgi:hypothetical protein